MMGKASGASSGNSLHPLVRWRKSLGRTEEMKVVSEDGGVGSKGEGPLPIGARTGDVASLICQGTEIGQDIGLVGLDFEACGPLLQRSLDVAASGEEHGGTVAGNDALGIELDELGIASEGSLFVAGQFEGVGKWEGLSR